MRQPWFHLLISFSAVLAGVTLLSKGFLSCLGFAHHRPYAAKMTEGLAGAALLPGDGHGGRGRHMFPENADASFIFMHGREGNGDEWGNLAVLLNSREALRGRVRLFLPTADERMVTKYGRRMNAWFDSRSDRRDVDEDFEGTEESRRRIENIIKKEIEQGIKPQRIIVAGFSQGGTMAYFVAFRSEAPLGGAVCLSGWCPFLYDLQINEAFANSGAPFLHAHGRLDPVVKYDFAQKAFGLAREAAERASTDAASVAGRFEFKTYPELFHTVSPMELNDVLDFVEKCLARSPQD